MLGLSILFLLLAVAAAIFGFAGIVTGTLVGIAKVLFFVFVVLWLVSWFGSRRSGAH